MIPMILAGRPVMRLDALSGRPFLLKPEMHRLIPPPMIKARMKPSVIVARQGVIFVCSFRVFLCNGHKPARRSQAGQFFVSMFIA